MDHSSSSSSDADDAQNVEEAAPDVLDNNSDLTWNPIIISVKPVYSESESLPSHSSETDRKVSLEDLLGLNSETPSDRSKKSKGRRCQEEPAKKSKGRRTRNAESWKRNVRKRKYTNGEEHLNSIGKTRPARYVHVEGICSESCAYRCTQKFSEEERQNIHKHFWSLNKNGKLSYYDTYAERVAKKRCRTDRREESRRKFTFKYYFPISCELKSQVCKKFFLSVLDISEKRISHYYNNIRKEEGTTTTTGARVKKEARSA